MAANDSTPAIGIDLGTTYTCVAVWRHDRVEIIVNDQGNRTTPSYVAFNHTERMIGDAAKNQAATDPTNTVFGKKKKSLFNLLTYAVLIVFPLVAIEYIWLFAQYMSLISSFINIYYYCLNF
ncbi:Mediator of RNA polymerase II transcription subunit 37c [Spatholobus suberectus]|nr:Mediator of RNA polymerase II transcription subunit 37c [Spatholobus suberectus]